MIKLIFFIGFLIDMSGAGLSYYPVFQDFDETIEIPFYKNDDFPNQRDLFVMNVYSDCMLSDDIFSQFSMNGESMCTIAQNWVYSSITLIAIGFVILGTGAVTSPKEISKIKQYQKKKLKIEFMKNS